MAQLPPPIVLIKWSPVEVQFSNAAEAARAATAQHCSRHAGDIRARATGALRHVAWPNAPSQTSQNTAFSQSPRAARSSGKTRLATSMAQVAATIPVTLATASASAQRATELPCAACWRLRFSTKNKKPVAIQTQPYNPPSTKNQRRSQCSKCCRCRPVRKSIIPDTARGAGASCSTLPVGPAKWMPCPTCVT